MKKQKQILSQHKPAELNVCHSTFGICFQKDLNVRCGDVSLLILVPPNSRPAVSFVFFYNVQQLAFGHRDGALVMACRMRKAHGMREEKREERTDSTKEEASEETCSCHKTGKMNKMSFLRCLNKRLTSACSTIQGEDDRAKDANKATQ